VGRGAQERERAAELSRRLPSGAIDQPGNAGYVKPEAFGCTAEDPYVLDQQKESAGGQSSDTQTEKEGSEPLHTTDGGRKAREGATRHHRERR
jgi:hypothetical protein